MGELSKVIPWIQQSTYYNHFVFALKVFGNLCGKDYVADCLNVDLLNSLIMPLETGNTELMTEALFCMGNIAADGRESIGCLVAS